MLDDKLLPKAMEGQIENEWVCSILDRIRECDKTKNYSPLMGYIEQVQSYVSRMESGLSDTKRTAFSAYKLLKAKKPADAMKELEKRWPKIGDKSRYD